MARKKVHRICVYLLDPDRRRILLVKDKDGPFKDKFVAPAQPMQDTQSPMASVRKILEIVADFDFDFISHHTSTPQVIDGRSVQFNAPLFVQLTHIDDGKDHVDFVFLAQASDAPDLENQSDAGWFNTEDLVGSVAPNHVKINVRKILSLFNV